MSACQGSGGLPDLVVSQLYTAVVSDILGVSADPVEFTKETKELAFQVKTTKGTPVGSHKTLFAQTTITQYGEPITSASRRSPSAALLPATISGLPRAMARPAGLRRHTPISHTTSTGSAESTRQSPNGSDS